MKIICVAACTAGIAHTYIAGEKLIKGARALNYDIQVETQGGTIGTENPLPPEAIAAADAVILAVDIKINGEERFKGKRLVRVKTYVVIKSPVKFLEKVTYSLERT